MRIGLLILFAFLLSGISAQGGFTKSSKDDDYLVVVNDGIQLNIGVLLQLFYCPHHTHCTVHSKLCQACLF